MKFNSDPKVSLQLESSFFCIEEVYSKTSVQSLSKGNRNWNSVYQNSIVTIQTKIYVEFLTQFQTLAWRKKLLSESLWITNRIIQKFCYRIASSSWLDVIKEDFSWNLDWFLWHVWCWPYIRQTSATYEKWSGKNIEVGKEYLCL